MFCGMSESRTGIRTRARTAVRIYSAPSTSMQGYRYQGCPMPSFYDRFVACSERWPDNIALQIQRHDHLESCTSAELRRMAESVGRWITENGFAHGSRLAILAD